MIIISKFHDYYDPVQRVALDKSIVYKRKISTVKSTIPGQFVNDIPLCTNFKDKKDIITNIIGFCGKIYCNVKAFGINCYTYNDLYLVLKKKNRLNLIDEHYHYSYFSKERIEYFIKQYHDKKHLSDIFIKHHTPVFAIEDAKEKIEYNPYYKPEKTQRIEITINPELKQYHFAKIKDPYTAYQDIAMYLSGVLGDKEKSISTISDKDMLYKKGFDEWSFKKKV